MVATEARPGRNILKEVKVLLAKLTRSGKQNEAASRTVSLSTVKTGEGVFGVGGEERGKQRPETVGAVPQAEKHITPETKVDTAIPQEVVQIKDPSKKLEKMSEMILNPKLKTLLHDTASVLKKKPSREKIERLMERYTNFKKEFGYADSGEVFKVGNVLAQMIWGEVNLVNYTEDERSKIEKILAPDLGSGLLPPAEVEQISSVVLSSAEIRELIQNPEEWFQAEWDLIDKSEQSPSNAGISVLLSRMGLALSNLEKLPEELVPRTRKEKARDVHKTRQGLYLMKYVLLNKDIENARQVAVELGMNGLFNAAGMVNGGVRIAINRTSELVERERITRGNTVPAVAVNKVRREVFNSLLEEANNGVYGNRLGNTPDEKRRNVERAVLIGYNWFIASEQLAVHVARGEIEGGSKQIVNEPFTYLAALYKILEFSIEKWGFLSDPQMEFIKSALKGLGEGDEALGRKRFDGILSINDLFSSDWRIEPIFQTIDLRFPNEEGKYFALGMRLRFYGKRGFAEDKDTLRNTWGTISEIRPLVAAKIYKEQAMEREHKEKDKEIKRLEKEGRKQEALGIKDRRPWKDAEDESFQEFLRDNGAIFQGMDTYNQVEGYLGKFLYPLYEQMINNRQHIDFAHLTTEQRNIIVGLGGDTDQIMQMMIKLAEFSSSKIPELLEKEELYKRTFFIDDVPFEILEEDGPLPKGESGPLSRYYSITGAEEPYPRIFNDTYAASQAVSAILEYAETFDTKQLEALVKAMKAYVSPEDAGRVLYNLGAAYLALAKTDSLYAWTGLNKLPIASSKMQRLFGMAAESFDPIEMRKKIDEVNKILGKVDKRLESKLKKTAGSSDVSLLIYSARLEIILILLILLKESYEEVAKK